MQRKFRYITGIGHTFEEQLKDLFSVYKPEGVPLRLVIFGDPADNAEYFSHLGLINRYIPEVFDGKPPVYSYVAQAPLEHDHLEMEVFEVADGDRCRFSYHVWKNIPYIVMETPESRELYLGGVMAGTSGSGIREKSDIVFSDIGEILSLENMPVSSIVRQWNYIEQITLSAGGRQNYQEFNDSRTRFYSTAGWDNGYPAATGIGTTCGGVIVDLDAIVPINGRTKVTPLNNRLQVPAHAYSPRVLIGPGINGNDEKSTPKFERAKMISGKSSTQIYISGTAAIRGENSLADTMIEEQTRITLENIEHLISPEMLASSGVDTKVRAEVCSLRIYLKDGSHYTQCRDFICRRYPDVSSVYLKADICRDELLVEIEGYSCIRSRGKLICKTHKDI